MDKIRLIPRIDNTIDIEFLKKWVANAIELFVALVREVFESFYDYDLEIGFIIGKRN